MAAKAKRLPTAALQREQRTASELSSECFDPNGSYTGVCRDRHEEPVQDADDL